ncbi:hypothetical protein C9374_011609 [Naegleria lovaniensis]|uniref:Uncharacterized protein n=1 Tax=Naegleria lovaniensis TaxID=51637 RepID=A0AA88GEJ8_NAELO|nr:uncharacterized protein C9374_011609 [Naegleria lovaniensis]KAG2373944.1 hypothetical protein C9374_011609 [Naegleria lovaniensis]
MGKNKSVISSGSKDSGGASIASITSNRSTFSTMASSKSTKKNTSQHLKKSSASVIDSKKAPSVYDEILKTAFKKKPLPSTNSKGLHNTENIKQEKKKKVQETFIPTQGSNDPYIEVPDEPPSILISHDRNDVVHQHVHELHQTMPLQESKLIETFDQDIAHPQPLSTASQVYPAMTHSMPQQIHIGPPVPQSSSLHITVDQPFVDENNKSLNTHNTHQDTPPPTILLTEPKQAVSHTPKSETYPDASSTKSLKENALPTPELQTSVKESMEPLVPIPHPKVDSSTNQSFIASKDDIELSHGINSSANVSRVLPTETPVERISKITEEEKLKVKTFASRNLRYNDPDELFNFKIEDAVTSCSTSAAVENVFVVPQISIGDVHDIIEEREDCKKSDRYLESPSEEEVEEVIPHKSQELIFNDDVVVFESPEEDTKTFSTATDGSSDFDLQEAAELAVSTERLEEHLKKTLNLERENQLLEREIKHLEQEIKTKYSDEVFEKAFPVVEILSKPRGSKSIERYSDASSSTTNTAALKPRIESNENDEDLKFELELLKIVGEDFKNRKKNAPSSSTTADTTTQPVIPSALAPPPNVPQTFAPVEPSSTSLQQPKQDGLATTISTVSSQSQRLAEYKARRNARMKQAQEIIPSVPAIHNSEPKQQDSDHAESKVGRQTAPSLTDTLAPAAQHSPTVTDVQTHVEVKHSLDDDSKLNAKLNDQSINLKPVHSNVQNSDTTQEMIPKISPIKARPDKGLSPLKVSPNRTNVTRSMEKTYAIIGKESFDHSSLSKQETLSRVTYLEKFMKDLKRKKQEELDSFEQKFSQMRAYFEKQLEARDNAVHHLTHQNRMLKERLTLTQTQIDDLSMVIEHILESQEKMEEAISVNNSKVITPRKGSSEMEDEPVSPVSGGGISTSGEHHHQQQENSTNLPPGPTSSDSHLSPNTIKKRLNRDFEDESGNTLLETPQFLENIEEGISVGLSNDGDVYLSIGKSSVPLGEYIKTL